MITPNDVTHPRRLAATDRAEKAWQHRLDGLTFAAIATEMDLPTATSARRLVMRAMSVHKPDEATVEERRQLSQHRLDVLADECWQVIHRTTDDRIKLLAIRGLERIERQTATLWGLNSPTRIEYSGAQAEPVSREDRIASLLERMASIRLIPSPAELAPASDDDKRPDR